MANACVPFAQSYFADTDFSMATELIFNESVDRAEGSPEAFVDIWLDVALRQQELGGNPIILLALGYQALENDIPALAIASFDRAHILLNRSNICEYQLVHFFIFAGRYHTNIEIADQYAGLFQSSDDVPFDFLSSAITGVNFPIHWLSEANFLPIKCITGNLNSENITDFDQSVAAGCP